MPTDPDPTAELRAQLALTRAALSLLADRLGPGVVFGDAQVFAALVLAGVVPEPRG